MNILFLDLSTKSTGYCISNSEGEMLDYGLLTAISSNNLDRIQKIQD
nr:MAG TPA: HOLLIDAY JUNCTION RESOLVASE [Caudoviricetes sp.]